MAEKIIFTDDITDAVSKSDVIFIAVGTPPKSNGEANLQYVEDAAREIATEILADQMCTIVLKSTVPIGTNQLIMRLVLDVLQQRNIVARVSFASNPEFLREGVALSDTFYPDRIVIGADQPEAIANLSRLYHPLLEQTFVPPSEFPRADNAQLPYLISTDLVSAEMTKYAANAFLPLKISFINEIAGLCEKVGADVTEVARGIGYDQRIGHRFLNAGLGWGGSCFPKDTKALISVAANYNYTMPLLQAVCEVNIRQRITIIDKLKAELGDLHGKVIAVLGLAFKPNTDDVRDSPAIEIVRMLVDCGAQVRVHDPIAMNNARIELADVAVEFCDSPYTTAIKADALLLATEWNVYHSLDLRRLAQGMRTPLLVDGRNLYHRTDAQQAGFIYKGVGK